MKIINDLVVVEVPKASIYHRVSSTDWLCYEHQGTNKGQLKLPFPCTIIEVIDPRRPLSCGQIDWMVELAQAESIDHVLSGITYKPDINLLFLKRI